MNDLVIVYPLKSRTGYIQYLQFSAGSNKGGVKQGDVFNDPFRLSAMTEDRINYTGASVVDPFKGDGTKTAFTLMWTPNGKPSKVTVNGVEKVETTDWTYADGVVTFVAAPAADAEIKIAYVYDNVVIPQNDIPQLTARMEGIELAAKARRIAIYY